MTDKAVVIEAPGGAEQLKLVDVSVGEPGPGEIRIRHAACGLTVSVRRMIGRRH